MHVCKNHRSLTERKLLSYNGNQKPSESYLRPVCSVRLLSTKDVGVQVTEVETSRVKDIVTGTSKTTSTEPITSEIPGNNTGTVAQNTSTVSNTSEKTSVVLESSQEGVHEVALGQISDLPPIPDPPKPPIKIQDIIDSVSAV